MCQEAWILYRDHWWSASLVLVANFPGFRDLHPKYQTEVSIMPGRSRLFISAESIPRGYNAVTLGAYLGGEAIVEEGEYAV